MPLDARAAPGWEQLPRIRSQSSSIIGRLVASLLRISINEPSLGEEEIRAATSVLRRGVLSSIAGVGTHTQKFEDAVSSYVGAKYAVAVNSGTAALQAALHALDIKAGHQVVIPSFTFVATASAVASTGARPVFADITRDSYTIDPARLEKKITKKTRAIIPVHLYGNVAPILEITEIAAKHGIPVIEDAAQSLGSTYRKKHTGTFFEMGCFSMYPSKVMTAGEGGFVTTNNRNLRDKLAMIRNHGTESGTCRAFGLNLRLPEMSAAVARVQLRKLPGFLQKRRRNAALLTELLSDSGVVLPREQAHTNPNWSLYTIAAKSRDRIMKRLARAGVHSAIYYRHPVHRMPLYARGDTLPETDWAASHVLSLPVHPGVSQTGIRLVAKIVRDAA